MLASFQFDLEHAKNLSGFLACGDEVGRGTLAGPVVVSLVMMNYEDLPHEDVKDSKKLSSKKREYLSAWIKERALDYAISEVDNETIDQINILEATKLAFYNAYEKLKRRPSLLLLDALDVKKIQTEQKAIIKGDSLSYGIACASILAKVHRDELMLKYHEEYPQYGFNEHKGYGTKRHIEMISLHGICPIHRKTFRPCKKD